MFLAFQELFWRPATARLAHALRARGYDVPINSIGFGGPDPTPHSAEHRTICGSGLGVAVDQRKGASLSGSRFCRSGSPLGWIV